MAEPIQFDERGNIILKVNLKRFFTVGVVLLLAVGAWFLPFEELSTAARICMVIFIGAAGLWMTEAIPPFATAIMVVVLSIFLLGKPGGVLGLGKSGYQIFLNPMASPVLALFFGGFIMAQAAAKHGLDVRLAKLFLKPFGTKPQVVLLGIILITALFSMFVSNTATTAMMFACFAPIFKSFEDRGNFKKAMILAVPFAANIGGMGTMIGTPPNAVAAGVLVELGFPITFFRWMLYGIPITLVLCFILWLLLLSFFKPRVDKFEILFPEQVAITWDLLTVTITFTVTILLWMTTQFHSIPSAVVALIPVLIFTVFEIIDRDDIKKLEWDVLILMAGGLTLGVSMKETGLSEFLVSLIPLEGVASLLLIMIIALGAVTISNFMSNTAAANLIIPLVVTIGAFSPVAGAVVVAFACSLAMSLPISTPPNAIAFATREITTRDMAKIGTIISIIGIIILIGLSLILLKQYPVL